MEAAKQNSHRSWTEFSPPGGETMKEVLAINLCISSERNYTDFTGVCLFHRVSLQIKVEEIIFYSELCSLQCITAFEESNLNSTLEFMYMSKLDYA